jgi:hypothetical protein
MWAWLVAAALAQSGVPATADFDGDGKPETVTVKDEVLVLPPLRDVACSDGMCEVEVIDVVGDKPGKELAVCELGPRDERSCDVLTLKAGVWSRVVFPTAIGRPSRVVANGNGILLGWYEDRWYARLEKMAWKDAKLTHVRQPLLSVSTERYPDPWTFTVDRVFPIYDQPGGTAVVANVAAGRPAVLVAESAEKLYGAGWDDTKRWFLVRTQSGLLGWATLASIIGASDDLTLRNSAG